MTTCADHQPLAVPVADGFQARCMCGWSHRETYELRAEALAIAYAFHDNQHRGSRDHN